jgi:hypothetical protein
MGPITLQQFIDKLSSFTGDERAEYIPRVMDKLSQVSYNQLLNFQNRWDENKPYDAFRKEQDAEIIKCIKMEVHDLGTAVRELYGLDPITLQTEV